MLNIFKDMLVISLKINIKKEKKKRGDLIFNDFVVELMLEEFIKVKYLRANVIDRTIVQKFMKPKNWFLLNLRNTMPINIYDETTLLKIQ